MGLRKNGNHRKVVMIKVDPSTEKTEVVRVEISMAIILPADSG